MIDMTMLVDDRRGSGGARNGDDGDQVYKEAGELLGKLEVSVADERGGM